MSKCRASVQTRSFIVYCTPHMLQCFYLFISADYYRCMRHCKTRPASVQFLKCYLFVEHIIQIIYYMVLNTTVYT